MDRNFFGIQVPGLPGSRTQLFKTLSQPTYDPSGTARLIGREFIVLFYVPSEDERGVPQRPKDTIIILTSPQDRLPLSPFDSFPRPEYSDLPPRFLPAIYAVETLVKCVNHFLCARESPSVKASSF